MWARDVKSQKTLRETVSIVTAAQANSDGAYGDIVTLRADNRARARVTAVVTGPGRVRMGGGEDAVALGGQP